MEILNQISNNVAAASIGQIAVITGLILLFTLVGCFITYRNTQPRVNRSMNPMVEQIVINNPLPVIQKVEPLPEVVQFNQSPQSPLNPSPSQENEDYKNFGKRKVGTSVGAELYGKKWGLAILFAVSIIRFYLEARISDSISDLAHQVMIVIIVTTWGLGLFLRNKRSIDWLVNALLSIWAAMLLF